jgi:hypothetical protein
MTQEQRPDALAAARVEVLWKAIYLLSARGRRQLLLSLNV